MSGATVTQLVTLDVTTCGECGAVFAMPRAFIAERQADRKTFYCPNGHARCYGESEIGRLQAELERERSARKRETELRMAARKDAEHEALERRKLRTRVKNLKERVKNGVCPCCHRSFVQLARHMQTKHPDYTAGEP